MPSQKRRRFEIRKRQRQRRKRKKCFEGYKPFLYPKNYKTVEKLKTRNGVEYYLSIIKPHLLSRDFAVISADGKLLINAKANMLRFTQEALANNLKAILDYTRRNPAKKDFIEKLKTVEEIHEIGEEAERLFVSEYGSEKEIEEWKNYRKMLATFSVKLKKRFNLNV